MAQSLISRDEILQHLKMHLLHTQHRMKQEADKLRRDLQLGIEDRVIKLLPYCQNSIVQHSSAKLSPRYYRPFEIEAKVGQVAYRLKLLPEFVIHPIFHVSQL